MEQQIQDLFGISSLLLTTMSEAEAEEMFLLAKSFCEQHNLSELAAEIDDRAMYPRSLGGW